jgi:hypothetical protein
MATLVKIGLVELAVAALSGWAMVIMVERPHWLERAGIRAPDRIRQAHLDLIFMGLILVAVGLAVQPIPAWIATLLVIGAFLQPLLFVPLALRPHAQHHPLYQALAGVFFVGFSTAWVALAILILGR